MDCRLALAILVRVSRPGGSPSPVFVLAPVVQEFNFRLLSLLAFSLRPPSLTLRKVLLRLCLQKLSLVLWSLRRLVLELVFQRRSRVFQKSTLNRVWIGEFLTPLGVELSSSRGEDDTDSLHRWLSI